MMTIAARIADAIARCNPQHRASGEDVMQTTRKHDWWSEDGVMLRAPSPQELADWQADCRDERKRQNEHYDSLIAAVRELREWRAAYDMKLPTDLALLIVKVIALLPPKKESADG